MQIKVIKRDGRLVDFDKNRIIKAIVSAGNSVGVSIEDIAISISENVKNQLDFERIAKVDIEYIQDMIEKQLIVRNLEDVAKAYILYRDSRARVRNANSRINKVIKKLVETSSADSDTKRENANIDGDTMCGSMLKVGGAITKEYFFNNVLDPKFKAMHEAGELHIHDADLALFSINCLYIDLKKLLKKGFNTGHGYLRPPATIQSAATLACIALQSNQNDCFGGQSYPSIDYDLAPYVAKSYVRNVVEFLSILYYSNPAFEHSVLKECIVKPADKYIDKHERIMNDEGYEFLYNLIQEYCAEYDSNLSAADLQHMKDYAEKKTDRDTFQAAEGMQHNFCTLQSRSGGQTPFSSINFGTDTSVEGRMISINILKNIDKGLGVGETAKFPIAVFKLLEGCNFKYGPNVDLYDKACESSAFRMFPNFVNVSAPMNYKYYKPGHPETEIAAMGAVASGLVSLYQISANHEIINKSGNIDISEAGRWLVENKLTTTTEPEVFDENTTYYSVVPGVYIHDSSISELASVKKWMKFENNSTWVKISYRIYYFGNSHLLGQEDKCIVVTADHPFPVKLDKYNTVRMKACTLKEGMNLFASDSLTLHAHMSQHGTCERVEIAVTSSEPVESVTGYDFETSTDKFDIDDIVVHNCRTRVIGNHYDPKHTQTTGRGNLFFTTINLPYLALLAREKYDQDQSARYAYFLDLLDKKMDDVLQLSRERFNYIAKRKAKNFPFMMGQHLYLTSDNLMPEDEIGEVIKQGSISFGFIGLAETLVALFGKHHGESTESQKYGLSIISRMNDIVHKYSEQDNMNYTLFATPAEGCSGRLLRACRKRFGIVPGVTDKAYLTNSVHVPVGFKISAYDKINIEAPYHPLCEAGIISYIELDYDATKNVDAFKKLVTYMADSGMTYFAINHPVDRDPICGYVGYFPNGVCPRCGRKEGEGVSAEKLLSLTSYSPDPEYAIRREDLTDIKLINDEI